MDTEFTARNVAKWVVKSIVAIKTTELVAKTAAEHTNFEKDDMVVKIGSGVIGWGVSARLQPITDAMVDKTTDFTVAQWDNFRSKKHTKQEEK
jgi:hypothetical protein